MTKHLHRLFRFSNFEEPQNSTGKGSTHLETDPALNTKGWTR